VIPVRTFEGKDVAVFGLGRSGIATCRALMAGGARVCAWDDNEAARKAAESAGVPLVDLNRRDWQTFSALVLSPGIPFRHPEPHRFARMAQLVGVPVIGDMELFARAVNELKEFERPRIVGVTGTNGKSTTTALIGHILRACGKDVRVGGNIGVGVLDLEKLHSGAIYVLELSSYQLDLVESLKCDVAVMLNLSPDHLARHGGMDGYVQAKRRVFRNQGPGDWAIIGVDDTRSQVMCTQLSAEGMRRVVPVSAEYGLGRGVSVLDGQLCDSMTGRATAPHDVAKARALPGRHNHQNAAAAYAVCRALGLEPNDILVLGSDRGRGRGRQRHRLLSPRDQPGACRACGAAAAEPPAGHRGRGPPPGGGPEPEHRGRPIQPGRGPRRCRRGRGRPPSAPQR
jgi:UDP-N-acetylmuramoylalanine--D-glutamate ligase